MANDLEELIQEVAVKHGIALGHDDPILVMRTINQRLMADTVQAQSVLLQNYKAELEDLATRWSAGSKRNAERILDAALTASTDNLRATFAEAALASAQSLREETERTREILQAATRDARRVAMWNTTAALAYLLAALVALLVVYKF